jgi:hypothetical protein
MGGFELFKELARRSGSSRPRVLEALADAFVRIRTRRNVEKVLIRRCILHYGSGLAVDGQHNGALAFLQMLQKTGRGSPESGQRLDVSGYVEHAILLST